jgi:Predicted Zn-dependent peptidases
MNIKKHTLSNGLRLVHTEDKSTQMVALNILYNVGARDEDPEHTGFAHLFEHLMFEGSINIPNYDEPLQLAGGENNAWTNNDITNYYLTIPRQNVETGFWLESDRMLSLNFNQKGLDVQKGVVMEEFKQRNLNRPYGDAGHLLRELAYKVHPYRWPTIGKELAHIENATLSEVKDFFFRFYAPNNAILAVTGNICFDAAVELTEKWFGAIPRREVARRIYPQESDQTEQRRMEVARDVPVDSLFMVFHMSGKISPDFYTYDILSDILCNGKSSRLQQKLVKEKRIFSGIDAYISGSIDPGLLQISGKPNTGITLEQAEQAVWEELEILKNEVIKEQELEKVKNKFESTHIFGNINYLNVATNLAWFELIGKAEDLNEEVKNYRSVTATHLRELAQKTFQPSNSCILYYRSEVKEVKEVK